jgi:hypothetical protein
MEFYGIKGTVQKLIKSYLTGRNQEVIIFIEMGVNVVLLGKKFNVEYLKALYWARCFSYYISMIYQEIYLI